MGVRSSNMRVRLIVETEVDVCDDESIADYGTERVRNCVRDAIENALHSTHEYGFDHDLCGDVAIFIDTVELLKE